MLSYWQALVRFNTIDL